MSISEISSTYSINVVKKYVDSLERLIVSLHCFHAYAKVNYYGEGERLGKRGNLEMFGYRFSFPGGRRGIW